MLTSDLAREVGGVAMFGTIARMQVKKGMESKLDELSRKFESRHVDASTGMADHRQWLR